jgi:SAM-dependent methyltransferase
MDAEHLRERPSGQPMSVGLSNRWFAWAMHHVAEPYDALLADRKRDLLSSLVGTIVEIGPGTGTNLRYYPRASRWIGIEPNPYMLPHLRRAGNAAGIEVDIRRNYAETMDLADESADVVVSTAVLCSVHDQAKTLQEIRRVLKPGGQLVFLEHVGADRTTSLRRVQRFIRPIWRCMVDGCDPARDTGEAIVEAGFTLIHCESFRLPLGPVATHIAGIATV